MNRNHAQSHWMTFIKCFLLALAVGTIAASVNYARQDQEHVQLTDEVRRFVPGSFARLADGITHYEFAGPPDAAIVVLIHGFSIPDYLLDPPFPALVSSGFRVLRYDLFGRGYSDRPDVTY